MGTVAIGSVKPPDAGKFNDCRVRTLERRQNTRDLIVVEIQHESMDITELNKLGGWEGSSALRSPTGLKSPEGALVSTPVFYRGGAGREWCFLVRGKPVGLERFRTS